MENVAATLPLENPRTCLITIVNPGMSDSVIKLYPAEHEKEKIWLDNAHGIRRWEAIERLIDNNAERGTKPAKPAKWHKNGGSMAVADLKEEEIPLVRLDGVALKAPFVEERPKSLQENPPNVLELNKKVDDMQSNISSLATSISHLAAAIGKNEAQKQSLPEVKSTPQSNRMCKECGKNFSSGQARSWHERKEHVKVEAK